MLVVMRCPTLSLLHWKKNLCCFRLENISTTRRINLAAPHWETVFWFMGKLLTTTRKQNCDEEFYSLTFNTHHAKIFFEAPLPNWAIKIHHHTSQHILGRSIMTFAVANKGLFLSVCSQHIYAASQKMAKTARVDKLLFQKKSHLTFSYVVK